MSVILLLSVIPVFVNSVNSGMWTHVIVYSLLSVFMALYLKIKDREMSLLKGAVFLGTFGLLMELVQYFIPYRKFEVDDIKINYLSALIAVFPGIFITRIFN